MEAVFLIILEVSLSIIIVVFLCALAIPSYKNDMEKAENTKAIVGIEKLKINASIYYAETGNWSSFFIEKESDDYAYYKSLKLASDGQIILVKKENSQQLSITPFISKNQDGVENDILLWLCGYAKAPPSYSTTIINSSTTIPAAQLPSACVH